LRKLIGCLPIAALWHKNKETHAPRLLTSPHGYQRRCA
jgi:hypothetical protein